MPWMLYNYIYLEDNTAYCAKYGWYKGTQNKNQKTSKTWNTKSVIQCPTNRNPAQLIQENAITVFRRQLYNSLPKYLRDIESVKTEKFKFELNNIRAHSWWAQNAQLCHCIRKQQHTRSANSSEGSRNLPNWGSPWLTQVGKNTRFREISIFGKTSEFVISVWNLCICAMIDKIIKNVINIHRNSQYPQQPVNSEPSNTFGTLELLHLEKGSMIQTSLTKNLC